jgi:heterotetrameric sarcosine oxidase gamma subunit
MLNARRGIDADLTVTRIAPERFLVIAPAIRQRAVVSRLRQAGAAEVVDVTAAYATLAVMGPRSRALLGELTDADLGNDAFPFGTAQTIDLGLGPVLALRVSFVGELGWELYPTADAAVALYDAIVATGAAHGLRHAGYHALDSLRCEKGYHHWPFDISPTNTARRLMHVRLLDPEPLLRHGESVLWHARRVGRVTSAAYGHHLGYAVGLAMIDDPELLALDDPADAELTVDIAGRVVDARVSRRPFYDPDNLRLSGAAEP